MANSSLPRNSGHADPMRHQSPLRQKNAAIDLRDISDQAAQLGIDPINRPARSQDRPPRLELFPGFIDLFVTRAQDYL